MDKASIQEKLKAEIEEKIDELDRYIQDLSGAQSSNTKSTAGDKHDTEREMVQQEIDNLQKQLSIQKNFLNTLNQISTEKEPRKVELGALVQTNTGWFYISIPLGKLNVDEKVIWCISAASPIGQAMLDKQIGENYDFNGHKSKIKAIL